jgi:hypothetical protein
MTPEEKLKRRDALGLLVAEKRDDAVTARASSGIEETWLGLEESYLGIDDNNRYEFANAKWSKPTSMTGPITLARSDTMDNRSTVFIRLTARYVDSGAARVSEIILPIDDMAFSAKPVPDPDLVKNKGSIKTMMGADGTPMMRDMRPDELPSPQPPAPPAAAPAAQAPAPMQPPQAGSAAPPVPETTPPAPNTVPMTQNEYYEQEMAAVKDAAEAAQRRMYGWMVKSKYPAEARKVIHDAARIGVGVLKGPFPERKKEVAAINMGGGKVAVEIKRKLVPQCKWIDPWNCFPDPACGESIHEGNFFLERDFLTKRAIKELKGKEYSRAAINKVLKEGPGKVESSGRNPAEVRDKDRFEVWYFYGDIPRKDLEAANVLGLDDMPSDWDELPAILMMINDTVVKASLNPLDSGAFPYNVFAWSRRAGHWAGIGIGEQIATPQKMCNAATRSMLNNAGKSAGSQIVVDREGIEPADGVWTMTPDKVWYLSADSTMDDVRKAFMAIEIPNVGDQLMKIVDYAFKLAEQLSNIPLQEQGQANENMPETFGATSLLSTNAQTLLRSIAMIYDDGVTDPFVRNLYEWLLLDPDVPNEEKGAFELNTQGSLALVERALQEQTLQSMESIAINPAFGVDPKRWFAEYTRSKRMDPRKVQYTPEEQEKIDAQPAAPPVQVQVAQVRAQTAVGVQQAKSQTAVQVEEARAQAALQLMQQETQHEQQQLQNGQSTPHMAAAQARIAEANIRAQSAQAVEAARGQTELAYAQTEAQIAQQNAQMDIRKLELQERLAMLTYANQRNISLDNIKANLAKSQQDNATKIQLAQAQNALHASEGQHDRTHDLVKNISQQNAEALENQQQREHDTVQQATQLQQDNMSGEQ